MLEHYNVTCQHRHIRSHSHDTIDQLNAEWQEISQAFDPKAKEQRNFRQLLDNLKSLRKAWKRPQQVSRIMTSMLATYELKAGAYVVSVDRYNHSQLGLKTKAAGSRQIVFECNRLTREEQMEVVAGICNRFASIFAQNAQYNLAQIDNQIRKGQMTVLARKLRLLQEQVYLDVEGASGMSSNQDPGVVYQGHRFSTAVTSSLWCPDDAMGVQTMPLPSFVPSPWEWPDLLKSRRPFHPMFFGLVARKRKSRSSFASRFKGWFSTDSPQPSSIDYVAILFALAANFMKM
ncbi:hypothetical protein DFQ28_001441 [Apophysomyces sp. BC1034]|nr:hypothetical protein DFQ29_000945 [Apophysomyces sp. BC1021]KAG0190853.1 hypothetical protein DFQ28_001441 [Apophysomyces sp. BC1034]